MKQRKNLLAYSMQHLVDQMIRWAAILIFSIVIILLLTYCHVGYVAKAGYATQNLPKFLIAALVMAGIVLYAIRHPQEKKMNLHRKMRIVSCGLLLVQLYLLRNIFFLTDWDPKVVNDIVNMLLGGEGITGWYQSYVPTYPNNLMLVVLETFFLRLNELYGVFPGSYALMTMGILNCLIANFACYQTYRILYDYTHSARGAILGYAVCVALVGVSPWMVIPYTDTLGLLFPVLILRIYSKDVHDNKWHHCLKWGAIASLAAVGYFFKPQCIIVFISIYLIQQLRNISKRNLLRLVAIFVAFICVFFAINGLLNLVAIKMDISRNSECRLGWQHFLMMGLNYERNGVYSDEDVQFSRSIATANERNAQNLAVAKERIVELKWKLLDHLAKKLLCLFNDGMFSWGMEGTFYYEILDEPNQIVAPFLRSVFYSTGSRYAVYASTIHNIWIGVLLMLLVGCILGKNNMEQTNVIWLSLLGLVLFELLFEVRARYLFTYVPFFVILAVQGLHSVKERLEAWAERMMHA